MRLQGLAIVVGLLLTTSEARALSCTIIADGRTGRALQQVGDCDTRVSPASTFKIALSVMGYDSGLLKNAHEPALPYRKEYAAQWEFARRTTDPTGWLRDSIVWYSQELTRRMGRERFGQYVETFAYGNKNLAGDPGRDNGLTHAWLSSSLKISPREQVVFLRKLLHHELPVSKEAVDATVAIIPTFTAKDGWTVRGKTGSGFRVSPSGQRDRSQRIGWFVGWANKDDKTFLFARIATDQGGDKVLAGPKVRDALLADLPGLLAGY